MIIWRICLWELRIRTRKPMAPSSSMVRMWVQAVLEDGAIQLQSHVTTSLSYSMGAEVRDRLHHRLDTLQPPSTAWDPWVLMEVAMNVLRSDVDVVEVVEITPHLRPSRDDVDHLMRTSRHTMLHHVMIARACADGAREQGAPYSQILWDVTHEFNPTSIFKTMSFHEAWLDSLNAALLAPVRCNWTRSTP